MVASCYTYEIGLFGFDVDSALTATSICYEALKTITLSCCVLTECTHILMANGPIFIPINIIACNNAKESR